MMSKKIFHRTTRKLFLSANKALFMRKGLLFLVLLLLIPFTGGSILKAQNPEWMNLKNGNHLGTRFRGSQWAPPAKPKANVLPRQRSAHHFVPQGVRHMVPGDFPTIQAAIDASSDGDTVLVSEGTYMENIRYRGKAIVVGSLYLIDGEIQVFNRSGRFEM